MSLINYSNGGTTRISMPTLPLYAGEIEKHWKMKESQRNSFLFRSPQLQLRYHLVVWLKNVAEKIKVSYRTIHLAIYILDVFMDNHSITKERLGFVALVCLMLAAKFEEKDGKIPSISKLNKYDGFRYTNKDFIKVEAKVLMCLDFGLTQPTTAHFAEYYIMGAIMPEDLKTLSVSLRRLGEVSSNITSEFLDISLKEVTFLHFPPSQVAAACVMATRMRLNLTPYWTPVLVELTGYQDNNIRGCANLLTHKFQEENIKQQRYVVSPDHGYISDSP